MIPVSMADWAGSVVAAISIVFLFRKSLWYWYFSIIATALWFYVFVRTDSLNVAGLQVFYTLFAVYGITRWHLQRRQRSVPAWLDHAGAILALTILGATVSLTTFAGWLTWLEISAVALSIFANWLTALKIVWCWPIWILTNVLCRAPLLRARTVGRIQHAVRLRTPFTGRLEDVAGRGAIV